MTREQFLSSFENVCNLFDCIGETSSRTEKELLLSNYPDKDFLKDILLYTYNPYFIYGVDNATFQVNLEGSYSWETIFEVLDYLKNLNGVSYEVKNSVRGFVYGLDNYEGTWACKIILKDLKIGINIETINKVFPKLIPTFKVGLCKTYEDANSLRYDNYIVQPKLDGVRIIAICTGGSAELYTRNGMKVEGYDSVIKDLSHECWKDYVLDGEIMTGNFDGTMEGLFALKKDKKAVYHVFDILTLKEFNEKRSGAEYIDRYHKYISLIEIYQHENINGVYGDLVSKSDISRDIGILDKQARDLGYEGLILKGTTAPYEFKRSYAWTKYKSWKSEDFEVIGMEEGTGKYEGMLGALVINVDGVKVKVGSGFSDEQRQHLFFYGYENGAIAEVKYQEKTKDGSLRFPTFIKFRNDI